MENNRIQNVLSFTAPKESIISSIIIQSSIQHLSNCAGNIAQLTNKHSSRALSFSGPSLFIAHSRASALAPSERDAMRSDACKEWSVHRALTPPKKASALLLLLRCCLFLLRPVDRAARSPKRLVVLAHFRTPGLPCSPPPHVGPRHRIAFTITRVVRCRRHTRHTCCASVVGVHPASRLRRRCRRRRCVLPLCMSQRGVIIVFCACVR